MITIIDYGMGNLGSIHNILKKIGVKSIITSDVDKINDADKLILPGVGSFRSGMDQIESMGLINVLNKKVNSDKVPILGICLGMQLMTNQSEEAVGCKGLSWINAETIKFKFIDSSLKIPHMGWNLCSLKKKSPLFNLNEDLQRFYFVHSYYVKLADAKDELISSNYGLDFTSGFEKSNIFGVQFHPEKSHKFGMNLLSNFAKL
jgi:glutamine amidotransferase